ncbi:MAG: phage holin family protein [Bdellovibrionia bacterium]
MDQPQFEDSQNPRQSRSPDSLGGALGEWLGSLRSLIRSEVALARLEVRETLLWVRRESLLAGAFGSCLVLSVFPFLAFLVLGLGHLLGGNYILGSLIVALVCAGIGGGALVFLFHRLKMKEGLMPKTRSTLEQNARMVMGKVAEMKRSSLHELRTQSRKNEPKA